MTDEMNDYDHLLFDVRWSVRYHARRRSHFETGHKLILFIATVLSSLTAAIFAGIFGENWEPWLKWLPAALVSAITAFSLVFGLVGRAWQHADLARQFIDLERQLEVRKKESHDDLVNEITDRRLQIEATEPPVLRVMGAICYNELLCAMGYEGKKDNVYVEITRLQRLCAPMFDLCGERFRRMAASHE